VQAAAGGRELGRGRNPRRLEGFQEGGEAQGGSSSNWWWWRWLVSASVGEVS